MNTLKKMSSMTLALLLAGAALAGCNKGSGDPAQDPAKSSDATAAAPAANTSVPAAAGTIGGHDMPTAAPPGSTGGTPEALGDHVSTGTGTGTTHTGAAGTPGDAAKQDAAAVPEAAPAPAPAPAK